MSESLVIRFLKLIGKGFKKTMSMTGNGDLGIVFQCKMTNCTYNHEQQCNAGGIRVTFRDTLAECYTYTQEPDSVKQVGVEVGEVSQCDVIDCIYNQAQRCLAETIVVNYLDDVPVCGTYTL